MDHPQPDQLAQAGSAAQAADKADAPSAPTDAERRAFLRLDPPLGRPYVATLVLNGETLQCSVHDLSAGGVALRTLPHQADFFKPGRVLRNVQLELGTDHRLTASLAIRLCRRMRTRLLGEQLHVGCQFVDLDAPQQARLAEAIAALERARLGA